MSDDMSEEVSVSTESDVAESANVPSAGDDARNNAGEKERGRVKKSVARKKSEIKKELKAAKDRAGAKLKKIADKKNRRIKRVAAENTVTVNRLELLVTIVNRNKAEYFADLIQSFDVNMQIVVGAHGTADARMRELFGLTDNDRAVIFSVIQENKRKDAMYVLGEKFRSIKGGKGIALALPFASMIGAAAYGFLSDNRSAVKEPSKDGTGKGKKE